MRRILTSILLSLLFVTVSYAQQLDVDAQLRYCQSQVLRSLNELSPIDYTKTARNIGADEQHWNLRNAKTAEEWCSGFWPGILWMTGSSIQHNPSAKSNEMSIIDAAAGYTAELEFLAHQPAYDHDLGFQMIGSFLKGYEYLPEGNSLREQYKKTLLCAADTLATLFNTKVGTMLSWPRNVGMFGGHNTIIDNMINLELLFWASNNGGSRQLYDIAKTHALTTMRHHFHKDGSINHVAVYDMRTGKHLRNCNHQGFNDKSLWSRGQSWAIYGYTMVYRYTHEKCFLEQAIRSTDVMLSQLPEDGIPYWDMRDPKIPDTYRDASAAAVIADALIELSGYVEGDKSTYYMSMAQKMLSTLSSPNYMSGSKNPAFLMHSVGNWPAGSEIDYSISYADYYYIEALLRLKAKQAKKEYKMVGPYEVVARDGQFRNTKAGSERDMEAALDFAKSGDYDKAKEIIDQYAETLQRLDGHDAPLCLIQCYDMILAMILSDPSINTKNLSQKPLDKSTRTKWESMIRRAIVPTMTQFENDSPYANGNWGAIVNRCRIACAIFLKDDEMYEKSRFYYLYADDNGTIANYVSETGQCQETGRDQGHAQLGLEAECQICEMAWLYKNDDLWGALDNRLMKGIEYTAKYNLGYDVPFTTWTDCTGLYNDWTEPGQMGRGKLWDIYQLPYNHYHGRKGLNMPYTEQAMKILSDDKLKAKNEQLSRQKEHKAYTYAIPQGAPIKLDYDVFIQPRGSKEWTKIDTYMAKVNAPVSITNAELTTNTGTGHNLSEISYAFFDFTGDVFVRVVCRNRKYKSVKIRPDYKGVIANVQNDSTVQFILFQPENVSVEFDGDITNNLLLFTNKPVITKEQAQKEAKKQKRQFVYVPDGFYGKDRMSELRTMIQNDPAEMSSRTVDNTSSSAPATGHIIMVPSNTTVYLAPGCYIDGTLAIEDASNVSIVGRGICRPSTGYEGVHVHRSNNVLIDGVTLCTCPIGESKNVTLHEVHSISHPGWGDGLNVFGGSSDILYDRVFCRNSDDCTTAYATRKGFKGSVNNVVMRNSTLWADVAHPIMIGIHGIGADGNTTGTDNVDEWQRDSITNLRYENIDIICHSEAQVDYQGCIGINCGDNNVVKGVTFDNIRIEDINQGSLFHIKTVYNSKYCSAPGRSVEDIYFRNIRYGTTKNPAKRPYLSIITGYDEDHPVKNITFEGLRYNGQPIYDDMPNKPKWYKTSDVANMYVNAHVKNLTFKK